MVLKRSFGFAFAVVLVMSLAMPAVADCVRWECKRSVDTVSCWERVGPLAPNYQLGVSCTEQQQCIWSYNPVTGGWGSSCDYNCVIEPCYEV
jgi:hypothetical protein